MGYFGIPFRNGVPIGLGSIVGFGAQQFDPSELFVGGTAGAWYDPSDLTTLFTTSAGTTPVAMPGQGSAVVVGRMLDKSGNGNHAIAFNDTTARPELRARVNLLEYSEQFDNAAWNASGSRTLQVTANATVAPDGTTTADKVVEATAVTGSVVQRVIFLDTSSSAQKTLSVYAKKAERKRVYLFLNGPDQGGWFDLDTGQFGAATDYPGASVAMESVGNGWWRCSMTPTTTSSSFAQIIVIRDTATTVDTRIGDGTSGIYIWGADLRPANIGANVPAYQRIADANTYDTSGFPLYLSFDGVDDSMYTPANLNLSGTDKVSVFAGVRKLSDAAQGVVAELSATIASNNGTFLLAAPDGATQTYGWDSKGTTQVDAVASSLAAPRTNVLVGTADIAGDSCIIRVNGAVADTEAGDQGTGNFGTYPLYIGARNNSSLWFNGHLHSLIIAGSAVSAGNISATEQWVAGKTGIQI